VAALLYARTMPSLRSSSGADLKVKPMLARRSAQDENDYTETIESNHKARQPQNNQKH